MVQRRLNPALPAIRMRDEMDELVDRFFHGSMLESPAWDDARDRPMRDFTPTIDVAENDHQITIHAEVPGLDPEAIDISVSGNVLSVHGEKKETTEDRGDEYCHCERRFGSFTRSIELPASADLDDIEAEQSSGVLTIRVKKLATAQARKRIEVKPSPHRITHPST